MAVAFPADERSEILITLALSVSIRACVVPRRDISAAVSRRDLRGWVRVSSRPAEPYGGAEGSSVIREADREAPASVFSRRVWQLNERNKLRGRRNAEKRERLKLKQWTGEFSVDQIVIKKIGQG